MPYAREMSDSRYVASLDKIILRLPDGLRDRLGELAKANGRSANAEAVKALEAWLLPNSQTEPAFVRLTDELWSKVGKAAKKSRRSIVEEIIARLDGTFSDRPPEGAPGEGVDLRAEIRIAMQEAVQGLLSHPERLKQLGLAKSKGSEGDEPASG